MRMLLLSTALLLAPGGVCAEDALPPAEHAVRMEIVHGKPYVQVSVNGRGPFRFLVDTGTGGDAIISPELAVQLNLPVVGEAHLSDPTGQVGPLAPVRMIDKVTLAGLDFYAVKAIEHPLLTGDGFCQGMLGFPLFRGLLLTLDYPANRLVLADGELEPDGDQFVHAFRMPQGVPLAFLNIGDTRVEALLDSAGAGLSLPESTTANLRFSAQPELFGRGHSLSTRFTIKVAKLATDVSMGGVILDQPWVEINPAFPIADFGSVPMQHFVVTFDQDNLLVRLDGPRRRVTLGITPAPGLLLNQPPVSPRDLSLVPVG